MRTPLILALTLTLTTGLYSQECDKADKGACDKGGMAGLHDGPGGGFAQKDVNGDGLLTPAEAPELFEGSAQLDANGDGGISRAELLAGGDAAGGKGKIRERIRDRAGKKFAKLDTDGNGTISSTEWKGSEEKFAKLDTDGSGDLSKKELAAAVRKGVRKKAKDRLAKLDVDGDGKISATEFKGPSEKFEKLDANGDGYLTKDEMPKLRKRRGERMRARIRDMDVNGDGQVSRDEFTGPADKFDEMDRNGDGVISKADRPERPKRPRPDAR